MRKPAHLRVLARAERTADGCLVWLGAVNPKGYGQVNDDGVMRYVHRVVYADAHGPIPPGVQIDHLCRNTRCVDTDHLEAVSPSVNRARQAAVTERRATCRRDLHPMDDINTYVSPRGLRHCRACQRNNRTRSAA